MKSGQLKSGREIHEKFQEIKAEIVEKLQTPLVKPKKHWEAGSIVKIKSLGKQGVLRSSADRGKLDVLVGNITVRVDPEDLTQIKRPDSKKNSSKKSVLGVDIPFTKPDWEVNVIGMRVDEALPVVEKAIDNGILNGLKSLRIIHGKGTGRLRQAIAEYLANNALVVDSRIGVPQEGGAGVTMVDLRPE